MRSVVIGASVLPLAFLLSAAPGFAQAPPAQPAAPPPAATQPVATPQPDFPAGAKIGLVNLQEIAQSSADGKVSTAKVQALIAKKQNEGATKAKQLEDNQNKLSQSGALMNDTARAALEKEIEKEQVEAQRFQQDAQAEVTELQTQLQGEFQQKLFPILYQMSKEKGLHLLLSAADAGVIWNDGGVDLTAEAIRRFDEASAKAGVAAPAAAPPAAAQPPTPRPSAAPKAPPSAAPKAPPAAAPKK
jgi:outer membrane protein